MRRRAATATVAIALCLVASGGGSAVASSLNPRLSVQAESLVDPSGPGLVHRFAMLNQIAATATPAQAAAVANNFNLVVVKSKQGALVKAMKAANPNLIVLVYENGGYAQKNEGTAYPESWYARDAKGNKITQTVFGNYLMDVSNTAWVDDVVQRCIDYKAMTGADGCYTDMLLTAPLFKKYDTALPINPATGQVWTFPDYQAAVDGIAQRIRDEVAGPSAANGVMGGKRWYAANGASSKPLTDNTEAAHAEIWIRDRNLSASQFPSAAEWQQDVDMIVEAEAEGRTVLAENKLWKTATADQTDQWRSFTLATYLLGTSGHSWYLFTPTKTWAGMTTADPWDQTPVGSPLGHYTQQGAVYSRQFATGFVAVNPGTTDASVTLPPGTWTDLHGNTASGTIPMPAHTGMVWHM